MKKWPKLVSRWPILIGMCYWAHLDLGVHSLKPNGITMVSALHWRCMEWRNLVLAIDPNCSNSRHSFVRNWPRRNKVDIDSGMHRLNPYMYLHFDTDWIRIRWYRWNNPSHGIQVDTCIWNRWPNRNMFHHWRMDVSNNHRYYVGIAFQWILVHIDNGMIQPNPDRCHHSNTVAWSNRWYSFRNVDQWNQLDTSIRRNQTEIQLVSMTLMPVL